MKRIYGYLPLLVISLLLIAGSAFLINKFSGISLSLKDLIILSLLFAVISVITLAVFLRGRERTPESQAMHTLIAVSLKLLLDMILALIWFFVSKKGSLTYAVSFFVLYLLFTFFTLFVILKILKTRSL